MVLPARLRIVWFALAVAVLALLVFLLTKGSETSQQRLETLPVPIPFLTPSSTLKGEVLFLGQKNNIAVYRVDFTTLDAESLVIDRIYLVYVNSLALGGVPIETLPIDHAITLGSGSRYSNFFGYKYLSQDAATEIANQSDPVFINRFPGLFFASQKARDEDPQHNNDLLNFEGTNGVTFRPTSTQANGVRLEPNSLYVVVTNETAGVNVDITSSPLCGDGWRRTAEACDDANTLPGDGCSISCTVEAGWQCTGNPSVCTPLAICGNGAIESGEGCDDQNTASADGCSATCQVESGWTCTGQPSVCTQNPVTPVCGNGVIESGESCDDADASSGDGCSATCQVESGYSCAGQPSVCSLLCSNGVINAGEECDDGNLDETDNCRLCVIYPPLPFGGSASAAASSVSSQALSSSATSSEMSSAASSAASSIASSAGGATPPPPPGAVPP